MLKVILSAAAVAALAGCNTVSGLGRDIQAVGDAMTRASADAQSGGSNDGRTASNDVELCGGSGASRRGDC